MSITRQKNMLIRLAYGGCIAAFIYAFFRYVLPIILPFVFGFLVAHAVVRIGERLRPGCRWIRLGLIVLIYGGLGVILVLATVQGVSAASDLVAWLPELYEQKFAPLGAQLRGLVDGLILQVNPSLGGTVDVLSGSLQSAFNNVFASVSGFAVDLLSGMVTAVPSGVLSVLAMIISSCFVAADYEKIAEFLRENMPENGKNLLSDVRTYLTETLFVVIRSYLLIMLLTFTELSILFTVFGVEDAVVKAALIAVFDILPILGTGGILIPWAVTSLVLGYTMLGVKLFVIYGIVTVVRNYFEPKIVGAQLGLHPIITLVSMFVGVRLFGFWGMFGLPIGISYFWKHRKEQLAAADAQ